MHSPVILKATAPATRLLEALKTSNEITIEAWVKRAATVHQNQSPGRIVTFSADPGNRNFTLGQSAGDQYQVRLRTAKTDSNGRRLRATNTPIAATVEAVPERCHLVYSRDASGKVNFYFNGADAASEGRPAVRGDFSNWGDQAGDPKFDFALANELTGNRPWLGEFHLIAIYDRALSWEQVVQNFRAGV